jgi:O-antigen/teichoic acid export membrane protein
MLLISAFAGAEAGFLLLALQIMAAPMGMVGASVSQVYVSRAPSELRDGRLAQFTAGILRRLMQIGIGPLVFAGLVAPGILPLILGAEWSRTGEIVTWMVPWMILQFLASPVSMALHVTGRQHFSMILQIVGLVLRVGPILIVEFVWQDGYVAALALGSALSYGLYLMTVLWTAGIQSGIILHGIARLAVIYWLPWLLLGFVAKYTVDFFL